MKTINLLLIRAIGLSLLTLSVGALAQAEALKVTGALVKPVSYSLEQLSRLPQTEITYSRRIEGSGSPEGSKVTYRGVLLRELLDRSGFAEQQRHDFRRTLIVAKASDGYIALFTWGELFNTDIGKNVLVVRQMNGNELSPGEGPLALRSFSDHRPGPRHVRLLTEIEVRTLPN